MERCRNHKITISDKKMTIARCVKFAGFIVCKDGVMPDPDKVKAIASF